MSHVLADIDATCAALGYSDGQKYHAEPDAMQGLKHLIWILRRDVDNHEYRRHLGHAKLLQTDLIYMLPDFVDDEEFADVLIRLLVILTNPTLLLYRDGPPKDNHGRKVFLELVDILQGYKTAFNRVSIWTAFYGKLKKCLAIDWALRSEEQNLLIERILALIRNVLQVPGNPELECRADSDASVHDQVIWALHQTGILDLLLFVISSPDEHQFHLHGLEILCLLYREQTAESLADASLQRSACEKQRDEQELIAARRREKQCLNARPPPARHSRFGGTYVIRNLKSISDRDIICHQPLERAVELDFDRQKQQQKKSHRHVKEESSGTRRSAFSVRLCLREFCIEVLRSAYNTLVRQVRRLLEHSSGSTGHDDSYLLWAMRFFMEFNRLSGLQLQLVSESLSVQCFHWVLTRIQNNMDMISSDKAKSRLWAKRLHVSLLTFRELLQSLQFIQKLNDAKAQALFNMLLNNICYVLEYREMILQLMMNYNEFHSTKVYLQDVIETGHIFIKIMEKFCKDPVVVQDKRRAKKRPGKKPNKSTKPTEETEEQLINRWAKMVDEVTTLLTNDLELAEEEQPLPFDATAEKSIDDQKEDCMIRIHRFLRESKLQHAVSLMRSAREVWPENDVFGSFTAAPEDELLLLREIFLHNIATVETHDNGAEIVAVDENDYEDEEDEELEEIDGGMIEKSFKFDDYAKRLLNAKIVRACTIVLRDWERIPTKSLIAAVTILHRIAYSYSCPAMLYQATLFRIFQSVFNAPRDAHQEELRRLGVFVLRKFVASAPNNPKIYAELLFYKSVKEANELEFGYGDAYESKGSKSAWTEEQENELRVLFEENQRSPATDMDVIDWMLGNLIDKTRTRRAVLKKLNELNLVFKAPTKKSLAAACKNNWSSEQDEELRSLYDQHRMEKDCLQRILDEFLGRKNKQQILKRMLQLHMIADKSDILPQKQRKRKSKKDTQQSDAEDEINGRERSASSAKKRSNTKQSRNPPTRKVVRRPLDIGTLRGLIQQVDAEKYQEAIDWLKECLCDTAEEVEDPAEDDDGVPLLPLLSVQKDAMEDAAFMKVLAALGIQPPIEGMENYWRIPIHLNAADLHLRARILGGEEIAVDVEEIEDEDNRDDANSHQNESESEEDFFDDYLQRQRKQLDGIEDYMDQRREKLQSLMYSKSDNEDEQRAPARGSKGKHKLPSKKRPGNRDKATEFDSWGEDDDVVEIREKDEDRTLQEAPSNDVFDQLKTKPTDETRTDEDDDLNFNSEDYRKRLLELGDSDEDDTNPDANDVTVSSKSCARRVNLIDSDSEEEEDDAQRRYQINSSHVVDKATNQAVNSEITPNSNSGTRKRARSEDVDVGDGVGNALSSDDDDALFIKRRKPSKEEQLRAGGGEEPAKRRCLAIIDDDDDDEF